MRILSIIVLIALAISPAAAFAQDDVRIAYRGEITDDSGTPITGIFPLTFKFYPTAESERFVWEEAHYVSVYEGTYDIVLGAQNGIATDLVGTEIQIAVEVGSIGEFTRHGITVVPLTAPQTREQVIAELDVTFADLADRSLFAVEATSARDCSSLGGKTLEELDRYDEVLEEMVVLRDRLAEVTAARLGSRTTTLERIGGAGGNAYSRSCPPGHVVTGARGGAGQYIDSIELICSPLE